MFDVNTFPGCCGISVIHNLSDSKGKFDQQDLRRALYGLTDGEVRDRENGTAEFDEFGDPEGEFNGDTDAFITTNLILASTIESQTNAIKQLTAFGFHKIVTFPGTHGRNITLWGFDKTEYKKCPVDPPLPPAPVFEPEIPKPTKSSTPIKPMSATRTKRPATKATKKRTAKRR